MDKIGLSSEQVCHQEAAVSPLDTTGLDTRWKIITSLARGHGEFKQNSRAGNEALPVSSLGEGPGFTQG